MNYSSASVISEEDSEVDEWNEKYFSLRVVIPHAFIKPPRKSNEELEKMDPEDLENRLKLINEPLPEKHDLDDYKKQLLDILLSKEESAILKIEAQIRVSVLFYYAPKDDEYLTCVIPLKDKENHMYMEDEENHMYMEEENLWKDYGKDVDPAKSEFGLVHFPSSYRFDFRNIDKEKIKKNAYFKIKLNDSTENQLLATAKFSKFKIKIEDDKKKERNEESEQKKEIKKKEITITVKKWIETWSKDKASKNSASKYKACFSVRATPYDPLALGEKDALGEKMNAPSETDRRGEKTPSESSGKADKKEEEEDKDDSDEEEDKDDRDDSDSDEEDMEDDSDSDEGKKKEPDHDTWIKVNLFLFTSEKEKKIQVNNLPKNKNEWPVMPTDETIKLGIKIYKIKPIIHMFEHFNAEWVREKVIKFAISRCHYTIFNDVLALCLQESDDPLRTALKASVLCEKRMKQANGGTEGWKEKAKACLVIAINIGETIPRLQEKLQDTHYYGAATKNILDQNLVYAVEHDMISVCHSNVFAERSHERWIKRGMKIFPFLPKISPRFSFFSQALLFIIFCIIFTYVSSTSYQIYDLAWVSNFDNKMFGTAGSPPDFWDISDSQSFYNWMENQLVPQIFSDTSNYSNSPTSFYWYLITPSVVVRQIRVKPQNCSSVPSLTCYENFMDVASGAVEDTDPYYAGYKYYPDLGGLYLQGISPIGRYNTGGYAVFLEGSITDVLGIIEEMKNKNFIDPGTRAIIIEFAIFSPNAGLFMMFEILVEFTHIGVVNTNRAMVVQQPITNVQIPQQSLNLLYVLAAFIFGYILQELAEMAVMCKIKLKELEDKELKDNESSSPDEVDGNLFTRVLWATYITVKEHFLGDIWNVLDFFINSTVTTFLILVFIQQLAYNYVPHSNTQYVDIHDLWNSEIIMETADITASIGLILSWLRVLYFALPVKTVGPLVIGMLRMYKDVLYFIFLMIVFLLGFTTAFDIIFAGYLDIYTGFFVSGFTTLRLSLGNIGYADSSVFLQLPLKWFGNSLIILYVLISTIILVNLLISMMGGTYEDIQQEIEAKWRHLCGELLLHYERFVLVPPPLNIPHIMLYSLYSLFDGIPFTRKAIISEDKWKLVGSWHPEEEWKLQHRKSLHQERLSLQPGPFSNYSTSYWEQVELDKIEDDVNKGIAENHQKVVQHIKKKWAKYIRIKYHDKLKKMSKIDELDEDEDEDEDEEDKPGDDRIDSFEDIVESTIKMVQVKSWKIFQKKKDKDKKKNKEQEEKQGKTQASKEQEETQKGQDSSVKSIKKFWEKVQDTSSSSVIRSDNDKSS